MLRKFLKTQRNSQNRGNELLGLTIIGVLALAIFLTADVTNAVTVSGHGEDLPQVWVEVVARDLDYINPVGPWVSVSAHEYEIINYHNFDIQYDYEFRHWVVEVKANGKDGNTVVNVPPRGQNSVELPGPGSAYNGGVLTGNCDGLTAGRKYRVKAYTRIHAWKDRQAWIADDWQVNADHDFTARQ